jgi:hypothetical protein
MMLTLVGHNDGMLMIFGQVIHVLLHVFTNYFKTSCAWRVPPAPHGRLERNALRMDKASAKMHAYQVSGAKRGQCRQSLV